MNPVSFQSRSFALSDGSVMRTDFEFDERIVTQSGSAGGQPSAIRTRPIVKSGLVPGANSSTSSTVPVVSGQPFTVSGVPTKLEYSAVRIPHALAMPPGFAAVFGATTNDHGAPLR